MNEMHVCRACGFIIGSEDEQLPSICQYCCASTWMIIRSQAEFVEQYQHATPRQTRRIFRVIHKRVCEIVFNAHTTKPSAKDRS